ncbi:protein of unknown function [Methylorubrum extorquens]|uniref:Uncharacterized protein n=1 Tax=Methylorubrum extorquens TaxID=408 RepID=A0A2N9AIC7_METEX|nr:protein of unknown function [Methylorubrum extorquens]
MVAVLVAQPLGREVIGIEDVAVALEENRACEGPKLDAGSALRPDEIQNTLTPIHGAAGIMPSAGGSSTRVPT